MNDIVDKVFEQEESVIDVSNSTLKRKHCEVGNYTTAKRNDAQDHTDIKRKYKIDYEDLEKIMKEETYEFDRKIALGEAIEIF